MALLGLLMLTLPVPLVISAIAVFRDGRKGYAIAGLVLSSWPLAPFWLALTGC
ncbi:MAG: hypothetical protein ACE149_09625 [Armatimonadota bacterium]